MSIPLLELEGTTEEIKAKLPDFGEQRLHIVVTSADVADELDLVKSPIQQTIEEKILARFSQIPAEERSKVPADLTDNLDHYIYGTPKK